MIDLYRDVAAPTLHAWARRLRYFRYCAGVSSGHMELPEELQLRLEHEGTEASFLALLRQLGIEPLPYVGDPSAPYTVGQPHADMGFRQWQSPGHVTIAGQPVFVYGIRTQFLALRIGEAWRVSPHHVEVAERVEDFLDSLQSPVKIIDPPEDSARCLCPQRYPHLWED